MNLLGAALYDPAVAVSKATSSLLALTAVDTSNLRITVTVPAHGMVRFRMRCQITGATTTPTILLGVLNGATVVGRVTPTYENATANATTQSFVCDAEFTVSGLSPGSTSFDAAYAVQVVVASTNIKYGGPNTNAGANAWGAFVFEAWDPRPLTLALDGAVNVKQWNGTNVAAPATAGIPDVNAKNINNVSTASVTTIKAVQGLAVDGVVTTVTNQLTAAQIATGVWQDTTAGDFTTALSVGKSLMNGVTLGTGLTVAAVSGAVGSVTGAVGSVTGNVGGNVTGSVGSIAGITFPTNFSSLVIDATGRVNAFLIGILTTVFTEGAAGRIAAAFKQFFNIATPAATMDHGILVDTVTTYTGNTPQTGDSFARIGAAGVGLTNLGDTRIANLDATVSSRTKPADTQAAVTTVTTTTNLTNLPAITANWLTAAGIAASALNGKGDWNIGKTGYALSSAAVQAIWDALTSALTTVGSIGKLLATNIDAAISSRSTYAGGAVASVTGNVGGNVVGSVASVTAGVTVTTNNDKTGYGLSAAAVQAVWDALTSALTTTGSIGKWIIDKLDVVLSTRLASSGYTVPPTVTQIRTEMDTNSTKLDAAVSTRLASSSYTAPDNADILLIKAKTDNLPAAPAAVGDIPTANQNADALLKRDWTAVTGEASRSVLNALRFIRNKFSTTATAGEVTIYKEDDTTIAYTKTITTDSTADPIVEG